MDALNNLEKHILSAEKLKADGVPSASLAILDNGKISAHVITAGSENTDTVYQACSISKAITALGVAKLVDQKQMSYETKVIDHLSQSTIDCVVEPKTSHLIQYVNVGMLLSHTSGLSQHGFPGYPDRVPTAEDALSGRSPSNTLKVHFHTFPGAQFRYSGGGFILLQLVLEKITGKAFVQLMQDLVLQPLEMTRSWYGNLPSGEKNYTNGFYTGYTQCETAHHNFIEHAAASLWSTPTDLLRAAVAVQDSLYTDSGFLTQATAKKMLTIVTDFGTAQPFICAQGLGFQANDYSFGHSGSNAPGYSSMLIGFHSGVVNVKGDPNPKGKSLARSGIAVMTNSLLGWDIAICQIISAICYLKGWPRYNTLASLVGKDDWIPYPAPEDTLVGHGWREWIGQWEDWEIVDHEGPAISYKSSPATRLRTAAAPVADLSDGKKEFFFVVDGLKVGVRLTWEDGIRVVQLLQNEAKILKRNV